MDVCEPCGAPAAAKLLPRSAHLRNSSAHDMMLRAKNTKQTMRRKRKQKPRRTEVQPTDGHEQASKPTRSLQRRPQRQAAAPQHEHKNQARKARARTDRRHASYDRARARRRAENKLETRPAQQGQAAFHKARDQQGRWGDLDLGRDVAAAHDAFVESAQNGQRVSEGHSG